MNPWRIWVLFVLASLAVFGCFDEDTEDDTSAEDGDSSDEPDGDAPDGDYHYSADGDTPADGDSTSWGDGDGWAADGDALLDGDTPDGDGNWLDGDGEAALDGDAADGDAPDGDAAEGEAADNDSTDGDATEGDGEPDAEEDPLAACPEEQTPHVLYLSSDDSNSVASPVILRSMIRRRYLPDIRFIRVWEFLNYYRVEYPAPSREDQVAVYADMTPAGTPGDYVLQVAARSYDLTSRAGRPMNLTFVLDTSGSMNGQPLDLLKAVCRTIAGQLSRGDVVSMVVWNTIQTPIFDGYRVEGPNDAMLLQAIDRLSSNGSTDLDSGLRAGYDLAEENFDRDRLNRVILISDGQANVGQVDPDLIGQAADDSDGEGIYLVGVGVGDGINDTLLERVTDWGRGAYIFIDSADEAEKMFGNRFYENMEIAARALRMEVTLPWYFIMKQFHGEEWSENPNEIEPQHLAPNDAMVFHQVIGACQADLVDDEDEIVVRANFADPQNRQRKTVEQTVAVGDLLAQTLARQIKGNAVVAYAKALEASVTLPRGESKPAIEALADQLEAYFEETGDADCAEMAEVLNTLLERL